VKALGLVTALVLAVLAWPATAFALDGPSPSCNGGSCAGWFIGAGAPVAVSWSAPAGASLTDCHFETITTDTSGTNISCGAYYAAQQQTVTVTVTVRRDTTPPQVTNISAARAPDANGWYNHAVAVMLAGSDATSGIASCDAPTYSGPDAGSAVIGGVCRDVAGNTSAPASVTIEYDGTAPSASASLARGPDANGWYAKPVGVSFGGTDAMSGIASCTPATTYAGPDSGTAGAAGQCTDRAGNHSDATATFRYDSTRPTAVAQPARPPDENGWYSKPLTVEFKGTDTLSGVASCTAPISYSKPDTAGAKVTGTCRDAAGNVSALASSSFKFDATPPAVPAVEILASGTAVTLAWAKSSGAASYEVLRAPPGKRKLSLVWRGTALRFTDHAVKDGTRYRYVVRALDLAGNPAGRSLVVTPLMPVYAPTPGTVTRVPPTVRWAADKKARFYNVQLYRGKTKVLSLWPDTASLRLPRSWSFAGRHRTLEPGTYRIFVWPAFGSTASPRYGKLLGQTSFRWKA
jgi:hypothetical protein